MEDIPALLGFRLIYTTLMNAVREDARAEIDALLGLEGADEVYDEDRHAQAAAAGFQIGGDV